MDILGPLTRATTGYRYIAVLTDRFSKIARAIPLRSITALPVAKVLVQHWILAYGPSAIILSDNGCQFASKLSLFICAEPKMKSVATATYHPQKMRSARDLTEPYWPEFAPSCQNTLDPGRNTQNCWLSCTITKHIQAPASRHSNLYSRITRIP